jgi:hypothetical protein
MIELELTPEMAVSILQALIREQRDYTTDETCCPYRIKKLREVIGQLDSKLDLYYEDKK